MKIILVGNLAEDRQESMRRFTTLLERGLTARGHQVRVIIPRLRFGLLLPPYRYNGIPKLLGYLDKFVVFPWSLRRQIRKFQPDVIHITDQAGSIYGPWARGFPVVVTCHDLLQIRAARGEIESHQIRSFGKRYQEWIADSIAQLENVVSVSNRTKTEVVRLIGEPTGVSAVVPNALHYPYQQIGPEVARSRIEDFGLGGETSRDLLADLPGGYLLQVGGLHWYKNRDGLIEIFGAIRRSLTPAPALVMIGPPLEDLHVARLIELDLLDQVLVLGDVSDQQLEALYNLAEGLLFPSLAEGFGWPIAEAQACGCPVFASKLSPMTEVGGSHCTYFDPTDPLEAGRIIVEAWPSKSKALEAAVEHARQWLPARMLEAYESIYREIAS